MSNPHSEDYERLLAEYQGHYARIAETQRRLREICCTATAPRQVVAITVGHGGVVTEVAFPTGAYKRMPPLELSAAVLETITAARDLALSEAAEILAPSMPAGVNAHALLSGSMDLQSMLPKTPDISDATRDVLSIRD